MAKIHFTTPEGQSGEVELSAERLTLGRADDNSIVIAHESVSSHHGEFVFDGASWVFNDLGSTNGTSVAGQRVESLEMAKAAYVPATQSVSHTGFAATAIDKSRRSGFGAKPKPKGNGYAPLYALALIALGACGYAVFTFLNLSE